MEVVAKPDRAVPVGRAIIVTCVILLPVAGSDSLGRLERPAILTVALVGFAGVVMVWYPKVSGWRPSKRQSPGESNCQQGMGGSDLTLPHDRKGVSMRRARIAAGVAAASAFLLSAVTDYLLWSIIGLICALILLTVVWQERRATR
jgi:hypothetical protein